MSTTHRITVTSAPGAPTHNGKMLDGKKEQVYGYAVVVAHPEGMRQVITARVWMGRSKHASKVYASIWITDRASATYHSGHGAAGGHGYHKVSAAVGDAISSAGYELSEDIHGRGDDAIERALYAIAQYLGYASIYLVRL